MHPLPHHLLSPAASSRAIPSAQSRPGFHQELSVAAGHWPPPGHCRSPFVFLAPPVLVRPPPRSSDLPWALWREPGSRFCLEPRSWTSLPALAQTLPFVVRLPSGPLGAAYGQGPLHAKGSRSRAHEGSRAVPGDRVGPALALQSPFRPPPLLGHPFASPHGPQPQPGSPPPPLTMAKPESRADVRLEALSLARLR